MWLNNFRVFLLYLLLPGNGYSFAQSLKINPDRKINHVVDSMSLVLKKEKSDQGKASVFNKITALIYAITQSEKSNKWDAVIKYADSALVLADKTNSPKEKADALYWLGLVFYNKSDYANALQKFFSVLKIQEEVHNKPGIREQYFRIGNVYSVTGNNDEALKYQLAGLKMIKEENLRGDQLCKSYRYIGTTYQRQGNYNEALKYFFFALDESKYMNSEESTGAIYRYIGDVYNDMGNYKDALKYLFASMKIILEKTKYKGQLDMLYTNIGSVYFKQAGKTKGVEREIKYAEAIRCLQKGLAIAEEIKDNSTTLVAYLALSNAYQKINNSVLALQYLNRYIQLKDSLFNNVMFNKISEVRVQYEMEKATLEEKAKQEKIKTETQHQVNLLVLGLILVIMTSVLLFHYIRQRNQKKQAVEKSETIHKMAELEMQSLRSQLNPHFMFNSLNSIQTLILKEDSDRSQSYLSRFARLLRMMLENADKPFIPLQKEIDFLQLYLSLEGLRVPDMQYSISTYSSLNTEQILIPNMFLQPYVENAIWHGLSYKDSDKQLQIRINREDGNMNYEIEDNGVGRKKSEELKSLFRKQHKSKGMELINKRIKLLNKEYGSTIQTNVTDVIKNHKVAGTLVTIKIPLKLSESLQN